MATDVRLLPPGTVIFEDISIEQFEGTVMKVIPKVPTKNQVCAHPLFYLRIGNVFSDIASGSRCPALY